MMIDSPSNPLVKTLRTLEQPRHIREQGLFLVEGVRAVQDGLDAGRWPTLCLYSPELLGRTARGRELLARLQAIARQHPGASQVVEASQRALEAAASTQHPQGVVAAFPIVQSAVTPPGAGTSVLCLVCDDVQDPGNLGTIFRTAEAAGATGVWLTPDCVYAYSPKVVRSGMGAHFRLPMYPDCNWAEIGAALGAVDVRPGQVYALEAAASLPYDRVDWTGPSALIVSNEAHGLTHAAAGFTEDRQGTRIAIPMSGGTESLNASVAAAVVLFEAARQRRAASGSSG